MNIAIVGEMIPILSIVLSMSVAIVWIVSRHRRDVRELEHRHAERMAAIEKGLELPPEVSTVQAAAAQAAANKSGPTGGGRYLIRGLVWLGVGLALAVPENSISGVQPFGWIAAAVGAAYLIYYFLEGRRAGPPPPPAGGGVPPGGV